ncbi:MAG TPA: beta-L-arabinofuranosidase domain-containing protein [Oscillospiraceae bacterium]|nr:beta-L-arabinofuranosidase domain-containing protein [Oscillospiraceae bacterium]
MFDNRVSYDLDQKQITLCDQFWSKYERTIREVAIPYQWDALNDKAGSEEPSHAIKNFKIAAGMEKGKFYGFVFQDSDVAKWLEGVSYSLMNNPDEKLEALADETIDIIEKAQQPDGYLDTYFIIKEPTKRWTNLHQCHELYCAGHMIEAAVAYYQATGKTKLLNIVCRLADHIDTVFGPEPQKLKGYPGHQEIELALVKLYKVTHNMRYLNLSKYFIEQRGKSPYYFDEEWKERGKTCYEKPGNPDSPSKSKEYNQTHLPVKEQDKAVGHAVRAVYMYTAMADLAAETGDKELLEACRKLWDNIENTQMYITGGIGSTNIGEAFTFDYNLPNDTVYAETCASIGLIFFANRMLHLEANSKYADVMEKALYNNAIASMAMDGKHFFYVNPLEVWPEACEKDPTKFHVKPVRQSWFGCACCPPNLVRLIESLRSYIYTYNDNCIYVNLFIGSTAHFAMKNSEIALTQETDYPWNGVVHYELISAEPTEFALALRFPGWCQSAKVKVNGKEIDIKSHIVNGYIIINRIWQGKENVTLELDMPVQMIAANPKVRADAGKVAIQRGPLVYCIEESDNGSNLSAVSLSKNSSLTASYDENLLGGMVVIEGNAMRTDEDNWGSQLYKPFECSEKETTIKAIPYYAWGNRGKGEMLTWVRYK